MKTPRFCAVFSVLHLSSTHFGAGGVTRTHDLLITKCIQTLRLTVFRDFGAFPLGILREVRPILSTVSIHSFLNCTQENGHEILTHGPVRRTRI